MTYTVLAHANESWIALKFIETGLISTAHMSSAYTLAHQAFKRGECVRVVSSADHSVIYCELNTTTHRVDEHGKVRPIQPVPEGERRFAGTIDITPTWRAIVPILVMGIENGSTEGHKIAIEEIYRMADAADAYNASVKQ